MEGKGKREKEMKWRKYITEREMEKAKEKMIQ